MLQFRKVSSLYVEPRREPGVRCPGCGNVPRTPMIFGIIPSFLRFKCPICGAHLRGNPRHIVIDIISYIGILLLFIFLLQYERLIVAYMGMLSKVIIFGLSCILVKIPLTAIQVRLGKYRRYIQ